MRTVLAALFALWAVLSPAHAAEPTPQGTLAVPAAARPGPGFDVERATQAYLASVPTEARAKSDAYFEGGYWLKLWGLLYGLGVAGVLLYGRISARLRDATERISRRPWLQNLLYGAGLIVLFWLLSLPLAIYRGWWREHAYGLSNLTLVGWFVDGIKGLGLSIVLGAPVLALIMAVVRRRRGNWWAPAAALAVLFTFFVNFIAPVFLMPVFNKFQPLGPGPVRDAVLSLARANGVPADNVYWFDASRQTSRISANVSGLAHTTRISLNDNLLGKTSVPEINAVMAHELGHYVLNHSFKLVLQTGLVLAAGFAFAQWGQRRLLARRGARWGLRGPADIAGLPLVIALLSVWFFAMTPVTNTIVRNAESEADLFGLNAAREPHAFASVSMRLAAYRKLEPTPLEEIVFYDHPSGATRVRMAMSWAAEHPDAGAGARPD
jgi:STE24 endopeptidase